MELGSRIRSLSRKKQPTSHPAADMMTTPPPDVPLDPDTLVNNFNGYWPINQGDPDRLGTEAAKQYHDVKVKCLHLSRSRGVRFLALFPQMAQLSCK